MERESLHRLVRADATIAAALLAAYFISACGAIMLARQPGSVTMVWYASAITVAFLVWSPRRRWPWLLAACVVGKVAANLAVGDPWARALATLPGSAAEPFAAAWIICRLWHDRAGEPRAGLLGLTLIVSISVPSALGATLGATGVHFVLGSSFLKVWVAWFGAVTVGYVSLLPLAIVAGPRAWSELRSWRTLALAALGIGVAATMLPTVAHPFVFLALPVAFAAVCTNLAATAVVSGATAVTAATMVAFGITLDPSGHISSFLPIAVALVPSLVLAAAREQVRLRAESLMIANRLLLTAERVADLGHWRIDPSGGPCAVSERMARMMGREPGWTPSRAELAAVLDPDDRAAFRELLAGVAIGGTAGTVEVRAAGPEGESRQLLMHAEAEASESGPGLIIVGTCQDVTDRARMERRLRDSHRLEAVGQLAAGVAHDFNNLLQAVTASLELIREDLPPLTETHEFCDTALSAARRGAQLTHHLLAYARKQALQPRRISAEAVVRDVVGLLTRTLGPHVVVSQEFAGASDVEVDPDQLQSALLNLGLNAGDAMQAGGRLTFKVGPSWERSGSVEIRVSDTGHGMDAVTLARATEPFFTTKGTRGSGLGLSMAQGFARQSGGDFHIQSSAGEGTSITLRLPVCDARAPAVAAFASATELSGGRVLLVDDAADVLETASALLRQAGFEVETASGPGEALAKLGATRPGPAAFEILVTDFAMPGGNGADLIRDARAMHPEIPAVMITGYADVDVTTPGLEGTVMLRKPFASAELNSVVSTLIQRSREPVGARLAA